MPVSGEGRGDNCKNPKHVNKKTKNNYDRK
jgi:hypothetical protein